MKAHITRWCQECLTCQKVKTSHHIKLPPMHIQEPPIPFHTIHIDLVGLLPEINGYKYILTAIDHFTCWPEAIPIKDITTISCARALSTGWISHFGIPQVIVFD